METPEQRDANAGRASRLIFAGLLIWCITKSLWLSDDSLITSRVILNFFSGHGLVFNIGEKVQAYTHPLWLLLGSICSLITGNTNTGLLLLSISCCTLTIISAGRLLEKQVSFCLFCSLWMLTPAVLDYSSSGLENPLGYLLITMSLLNIKRGQTRFAIACLSALPLIRLDYALISLPISLGTIWIDCRRRQNVQEKFLWFSLKHFGIGITATLLPTSIYLLASKIYYGYYLPNTFWAKSGTGLKTLAATQERMQQGLIYISSALQQSPTGPIVIAFTIYLLASEARKYLSHDLNPSRYALTDNSPEKPSSYKKHHQPTELYALNAIQITAGISSLLYMTYIIYIGGDFMDGRFMSIPFFLMTANTCLTMDYASSTINSAFKSSLIYTSSVVIIATLIINTKMPSTFTDGAIKRDLPSLVNQYGIADERAYYIASRGLYGIDLEVFQAGNITNAKKHLDNLDKIEYRREPIVMCGGLGRSGMIYLYRHHVDQCALADAFLSRIQPERGARVGHYSRALPEGYLDSIKTQKNLVSNKDYKDLLESVWTRIKQ